jgi:hypothetical protein
MSAFDPKRTSPRLGELHHARHAGCQLVAESTPQRVQLIQQRLGALQIRGVETFGVPTVCVGEDLPRFIASTCLLEETGKTCRRPEFPKVIACSKSLIAWGNAPRASLVCRQVADTQPPLPGCRCEKSFRRDDRPARLYTSFQLHDHMPVQLLATFEQRISYRLKQQ